MLSSRPKSFIENLKLYFKKSDSPITPLGSPEDQLEEVKLQRFDAERYYQLVEAKVKVNDKPLHSLSFNAQGLQLIAQYYQDKYQTHIHFKKEEKINYKTLLKNFQQASEKNIRAAFVIQESPPSKHVIPLIYIKENGEEGLLLADSLGVSRDVSDTIAKETGLKVYAVRHPRQASQQGCKVDALIFSRDCTGKYNDQDIIPNLLTKLKDRAEKDTVFSYQTKLPDELLKTSQISSFTHFHTENNVHPIHKYESLSQFITRYSDKSVVLEKAGKEIKKDSVPSYLRMKSIKLGKVVERQFYINQLKQQFADTWTDGLRKEFIAQIKHSEDGDLFTIANNFLKMKLNPQEKIEIVIAR